MIQKRCFVVGKKEYEGEVILDSHPNSPNSSQVVRVWDGTYITDEKHKVVCKKVSDFFLYPSGIVHTTVRTIGPDHLELSRLTEFEGQWLNRYHYRAALTLLCIGRYHRAKQVIKIYDLWKMIAKATYNAWPE